MNKYNLNEIIKKQDINKLKEIVIEVKSLKDTSISKIEYAIIANYYKDICKFEKKVFEDQSTCDVSNGIEETVPYQLGLIKAYCKMILM